MMRRPIDEFQSHAGSIEAPILMREHIDNALCFNPTLVRLRLDDPAKGIRLHLMFQSHAGSIEAKYVYKSGPWPSGVSIPRWFD